MARLVVEAEAEDTIAKSGNKRPCYVVVSVTDAAGIPITGLKAANFSVQVQIVGPGGALVKMTSVSAGHAPGVYITRVVPIKKLAWKAGVYIFSATVTRGVDKGQALARCRMD